jgi:hypothetical protein
MTGGHGCEPLGTRAGCSKQAGQGQPNAQKEPRMPAPHGHQPDGEDEEESRGGLLRERHC